MEKCATVEEYVNGLNVWTNEITLLRQIVLKSGLDETFKWMHPCYTFNTKNIVLIHEFKHYCALLFHKGALLKDDKKLLVQQTENVQSQRQLRFQSLEEIRSLEPLIHDYIAEAIEIEKSGKIVPKKQLEAFSVPAELEQIFAESASLKTAFFNLTPGRQKGYLLRFTQAKQAKTRIARIEKNIDRILFGKGLNDCVCGHSKKMPNCDGAHKMTS